MRTRPTVLILLAAFMLSASPARAVDRDKVLEAREHNRRGNTLYDLRRFRDAAKEYEAAFELVDEPSLLFNIAQAYRYANDYEEAIGAFRSFLRREPDSKLRGEVGTRIHELQELLQKSKASQEAPPTDTLPPKTNAPRADAPPPAQLTREELPFVGPPFLPNREAPPAERRRARNEKLAGFVVAGVGVLALAGGVAAAVIARNASEQIVNPPAGATYSPSLQTRGETAQSASIGLFVGAGAAFVACAVVEALAQKTLHGKRAALSPVVGPKLAGASVRVEF